MYDRMCKLPVIKIEAYVTRNLILECAHDFVGDRRRRYEVNNRRFGDRISETSDSYSVLMQLTAFSRHENSGYCVTLRISEK